ncbi:MAG: hypothetical protein AAFU77_14765 [Myxococcota bacterium]
MSELAVHDPTRHQLPVKVTLRGKHRIDDVEKVHAFNSLDFFILSNDMADAVDEFTQCRWPRRRAVVHYNNRKLRAEYCVLVIDRLQKVGTLTAAEADWTPDASYPVAPNALGVGHLALDEELKFPIISDTLVAYLIDAGFHFFTKAYPVETRS